MEIIKLEKINKAYGEHIVLDNFNLSINSGECVVIMGKSGCGKSTLLNIIGLIETYDSGSYTLLGKKNIKLNTKEFTNMLRYHINFIFQNFALMEDDTVEKNLLISLEYSNLNKKEKIEKIKKTLDDLGLSNYLKKKIINLSGGEQQRIAIARCLLKPCDIILADEPTAALDEENKEIILTWLKKLQTENKTIIIATHDETLNKIANRKIVLT